MLLAVGVLGRRGANSRVRGGSTAGGGCSVVAGSNRCTQVSSKEGQFKFHIGVLGHSPGQLQCPPGVAVDTNGDVILVDNDNC